MLIRVEQRATRLFGAVWVVTARARASGQRYNFMSGRHLLSRQPVTGLADSAFAAHEQMILVGSVRLVAPRAPPFGKRIVFRLVRQARLDRLVTAGAKHLLALRQERVRRGFVHLVAIQAAAFFDGAMQVSRNVSVRLQHAIMAAHAQAAGIDEQRIEPGRMRRVAVIARESFHSMMAFLILFVVVTHQTRLSIDGGPEHIGARSGCDVFVAGLTIAITKRLVHNRVEQFGLGGRMGRMAGCAPCTRQVESHVASLQRRLREVMALRTQAWLIDKPEIVVDAAVGRVTLIATALRHGFVRVALAKLDFFLRVAREADLLRIAVEEFANRRTVGIVAVAAPSVDDRRVKLRRRLASTARNDKLIEIVAGATQLVFGFVDQPRHVTTMSDVAGQAIVLPRRRMRERSGQRILQLFVARETRRVDRPQK